jgi:hypothetical protein
MRAMKPWVRMRLRRFGWYVRFKSPSTSPMAVSVQNQLQLYAPAKPVSRKRPAARGPDLHTQHGQAAPLPHATRSPSTPKPPRPLPARGRRR